MLYPGASAIWQSYRKPFAFLGRQLAVRFVDYPALSATVAAQVPRDAVVVSDMANEINWLNGNNTILFPLSEPDLRELVSRYDVAALYEHPLFPRDWAWIPQAFQLVDERNGRLWLRKDLAARRF